MLKLECLPCRSPARIEGRRGFTLIELLVVIAIIAILIGLLLPAVQQVRESAARTQCSNNLHQLGLACQNYHSQYGALPSGGWGWGWVGDASRGGGKRQPGGWIYQTLPFMEETNLYKLSINGPGALSMIATPAKNYNCPSRRTGGPFTGGNGKYYNFGGIKATQMARSDYAANSGDWINDQSNAGPSSLAQGDDPNYAWPDTSYFHGVIFQRSVIRLTDIKNGTSNTFLAGEKYLNPLHYLDGGDPGDNENMYVGFDNDISRTTDYPPQQDTRGYRNTYIFGSAHTSGLNMLYCDGSVQFLTFGSDPAVFKRAGNRN